MLVLSWDRSSITLMQISYSLVRMGGAIQSSIINSAPKGAGVKTINYEPSSDVAGYQVPGALP